MNDAFKDPSHDSTLKLHWPTNEDAPAAGRRVVVELLFVDGLALTSVSVPSGELLQAVAQKLAHYPLISPDGFVSIVSDEVPEARQKDNAIALNQLVAEAISTDMLDDEPNAAQMLAELRNRLLKSLGHVEQVIASLLKP
jgi:hypothetical protein